MIFEYLSANASTVWLIIAVLLGLAELALPGVFLVFFAIAAAMTAALAYALPDMPIAVQMLSFGAWSIASVLVGKRLYTKLPVPTSDPDLNNRAARMIGQTARVSDAIENGSGRVRIGDGEWPASGADQPAGAKVRVLAVENGVVRVAPLDG